MILALLCASILIPAASLVVWVFTERWAWPELFPQVLSDRAVMEIVRRKGELVSLMASSVMISSVGRHRDTDIQGPCPVPVQGEGFDVISYRASSHGTWNCVCHGDTDYVYPVGT